MKPWQQAFKIFACLWGISLIGSIFQETFTIDSALSLVIGGLSLISIYGYAYRVAVGNRVIAIVIFLVNLLGVLAVSPSVAELLWASIQQGDGVIQIIVTVLAIGFTYAYLLPQYRYAFSSSELWQKMPDKLQR